MRTILTAFTALMLLGTNIFGEVLITPSEAALPPKADVGLDRRGITRGPSLDQISPNPAMTVRSPLALKVKFTAISPNGCASIPAAMESICRTPKFRPERTCYDSN
jgi:hypothetical protein